MDERPLNQLEPGEKGRIIRLGGAGSIRRRLMDMGMVSGAVVDVERVAPLGDPIKIGIKGYDLALRKNEAEHVIVEVTGGLLSNVPAGETVVISGVRAGRGMQRRLVRQGLVPGLAVRVVSSGGPGPVVVENGGARQALGHGVARKIYVVYPADNP